MLTKTVTIGGDFARLWQWAYDGTQADAHE
jgi:hypothetical protein